MSKKKKSNASFSQIKTQKFAKSGYLNQSHDQKHFDFWVVPGELRSRVEGVGTDTLDCPFFQTNL